MSSKLVFCADTVPLEVLESMGFGSDTIRIGDSILFQNSTETAKLTRIEYDKQMYHPGYVKLKFTSVSAQSSPASLIRKEYLDNLRFIDLVAVGDGNDNFEKITSDDMVYIAQNFYIQGFSIKYEKTDTYSFTLECYSFDRKLTLSKYCKVYSGVSLATGICNEVIKEQLGDLYSKLADVNGQAPEDLNASDLFLLGYYLLTDDERNKVRRVMALQNKSRRSAQEEKELADSLARYKSMGFTSYDGTVRVSTEDDYGYRTLTENNNEVTHPYLVQYNESAYDFIARTAHMCGEFFYFEHGKICLGLPRSSRELAFDPAANPQKEYGKFFSYSAVADDEEARVVASSVDSYHGDYLRGDTGSSQKYFRNSPNVSDESFYPLRDDMLKRIDYGKRFAPINAVGTLFTIPGDRSTALAESAAVFLLEMLDRAWLIPKHTKKWYDKHHPTPQSPPPPPPKSSEKKNSDSIPQNGIPPGNECKVSDEYVFNMSNEALDLISVMEEASEQGRVELSMESMLPNLYLGDSISISNVEGNPSAVVVRMRGEFYADYLDGNLSQTKSHFVEVLKYVEYDSKSIGTCRLPFPAKTSVQNNISPVPMTGKVVANNDPCYLGRVKVQFDWEKKTPEEKLPWMRVVVPFAGGGQEDGGFCMVPSVGEHVMVDFADGNINRPFVMGSLYYRQENKDGKAVKDHAPSIGERPDDNRFYRDDYKTRSIVSGNGHAIIFKDLEDTSILKMIAPPFNAFWPASQKQKFEATGKIQNNPFGAIKGGGITIKDGTGMCRVDIDPDHRTLRLDSRFGNVEMNAFTGITINAPNGDVTIRGKNIVMEAGNNITLQAGTNIDNTLHQADELAEIVGGSLFGTGAGKALTALIKSKTGVDIDGAFDLSYLRSILEVFLRPVEGSLQLKSNRNTIITSGTGKVTLDSSLRSSVSTFTPDRGTGNLTTAFNDLSKGGRTTILNDHIDIQDAYIVLKEVISVLLQDVDSFFSAMLERWKTICKKADAISEQIQSLNGQLTEEFLNNFSEKISKKSVLDYGINKLHYEKKNDTFGAFPQKSSVFKTYIESKEDQKDPQNTIPSMIKVIVEEHTTYNDLKNAFKDLCKDIFYLKEKQSDVNQFDEYLRRSKNRSRFSMKIPASRISFSMRADKTIVRLSIKKKSSEDELLSITLPQITEMCFNEDWRGSFAQDFSSFVEQNVVFDDTLFEFIKHKYTTKFKKSVIIKCLLFAQIGNSELIKFSQNTIFRKDPLDYLSFKDEFVNADKNNWSDFVLRIQDANSENYRGAVHTVLAFCSSFMANSFKGGYSYANGKHAFLPSLRKLTGYEGEAGPREFKSEVSQAGAILLSSNAGQYVQFDESNPRGYVRQNPDIDNLKRYLLKLF